MEEQYEMAEMTPMERFTLELTENLSSGRVIDYDSVERNINRLQCSPSTDLIELKAYTPKKDFLSNLLRFIFNRWPKSAFISAVIFKHFGALKPFLMLIPRSQVETMLQIRQSPNGLTVFHYFARQDTSGEFEQFLDNIEGEDVRFRLLQIENNDGHTPLHLAAKRGKFCNMQVMLESVNEEHRIALLLNQTNNTRSTVLHYIIRFGGIECINRILSIENKRLLYPLLTKRNNNGKTPEMMAIELYRRDFGLREFLSQSVTARRDRPEDMQENEESLEEECENCEGLQEENGTLLEENRGFREDIESLKEKNERLEEENRGFREECGSLREKIGSLREENGILQEANRGFREDIESLKEKNGRLEEENRGFREDIESLGEDIESLKKSGDEKLEIQKRDSDRQQREIDELRRTINFLLPRPIHQTILQDAEDSGSTTDGTHDSDN